MINYTRDWNRRVVKKTEVNELHEDEEVRICSTDYSFCGINATTRKLHVALSKNKMRLQKSQRYNLHTQITAYETLTTMSLCNSNEKIQFHEGMRLIANPAVHTNPAYQKFINAEIVTRK